MPSVEASQFGIESALSDIDVHHELCPEAKIYFNAKSTKDIGRAIRGIQGAKKAKMFIENALIWETEFNSLRERIGLDIL